MNIMFYEIKLVINISLLFICQLAHAPTLRVVCHLISTIKLLRDYKNSSHEELAQYVLQLFIQVTARQPMFLQPQIQDVLTTMLQIVKATQREDDTYHVTLEFMTTLAKAAGGAPMLCQKNDYTNCIQIAFLVSFSY